MKKILFTLMATCVMAGANALAQDGGDPTKDLAKLFKGQLIEVDGEKTKTAEFDAGKEYYLIYHSASW